MLTEDAKKELEKQKYRLSGSHSAVKICGWTKKMIKGEGGCYKLKFYGIRSNQCLQMTTSMSCANRCIFCWRGYKAPVSKEWNWGVDDPEMIIEESMKHQYDLLVGLKGFEGADKKLYEESLNVKHVALSLTGEPIIYPKINEIIDGFHKRGISTFLVTNATYPEQIKNLRPITQLYISLDAPNSELLKEIDNPLFPDYWERLNKSLEYMHEKKERTCIRVTIIKEVNDVHPEQWAQLINKAKPDFIEIKGYMFIGASRQRLDLKNMPYHEDIVEFTKKILNHLPEYDIVSEHIPSRVVMLALKKFKKEDGWHTWIDFEKFKALVDSGKEFTSEDYLRKTPETGLSGKGTKDVVKKLVNEDTDELEFWKGSQSDEKMM